MPEARSSGRSRVLAVVVVAVVVTAGIAVWKVAAPGRHQAQSPATEAELERRRVEAVDPTFDPDAPAGTIAGLVKDAQGRPVDGAVVAIIRQRGRDELPSFGRPTPRTTSTSGGGRFQLSEVLPGDYGVTATAPEGSPARQSKVAVASGKTTQVTLTLGTGGALFTGEVQDVGGGPIAGARAMFRQFGFAFRPGEEPPVFQVSANDQGVFKIRLGPGDHDLTVRAPGYAPARDRVSMSNDLTRRYRLNPAARLAGRVLDRQSQDPVPEATVWLRLDRVEGWVDRETRSDQGGRFTFDDLAAGGYVVLARSDGRVGLAQTVAVGIAQGADVDVFVERGRAIKGKVVDAAGKGLVGIRVMASRADPPYERPVTVKSGADGAFTLEGLLPAKYRVNAWGEGRGVSKPETAQVTTKDVDGVRLALEVPTVVRGVVLDAAGNPVAEAMVQGLVELKNDERRFAMDRATTDEAGRFELNRLAPGKLTITAKHPERGNAKWGPDESSVAQRAAITLRVATTASIAGRVTFEDGTPAPGVMVMAPPQQVGGTYVSFGPPEQATTDAEGRFRLGGLDKGRYMLFARRNDSSPPGPRARQEVTLELGEHKTGVELAVIAGGKRIAGRVIDPQGQPVSGAIVSAGQEREGFAFRMPVREGMPSGANAVTDPDGHFTLDDLQEGQYTVWATDSMHADGEQKGVAAGASGVTVRMQGGASVAGVVRTRDGQTVSDYTIAALPASRPGASPDERMRMQVTARMWSPSAQVHDPSGAFFLGRLAAGTHDLTVTTADGQGGVLPVTVAASEKKEGLEVRIEVGAKVVGRVVELESGTPMEGVNVMAMSPTTRANVVTARDGSFTLTGLAPGRSRIEFRPISMETHVPENTDIELKPGAGNVDVGVIKMMKGNVMEKAGAAGGRVGFTVSLVDGKPTATGITPGFPAEKLGIKQGELVLSLNGTSTEGLGNGALRYLLSGKVSDPPVVVKVQPRDGGPPRELKVERVPMDHDPSRPAAGGATARTGNPAP
jgi:protocatechuate 3,4-dioxygenase beta subunit